MRNNVSDETKKLPGRPLLHKDQDDAMSNYSVRLTARQARIARRIGGKSLSTGLRIAIEDFEKRR